MTTRRPRTFPLDAEDERTLANWLRDKNTACPCCRNSFVTAVRTGIRFKFLSDFSGQSQPGNLPVILLTCSNCGFISSFCPFTVGLIEE